MNFKFLKHAPIIVMISLFTITCKKSGKPEVVYTTLKALEFKTNNPVADATVKLYKCVHPNPWGCLEDSVVRNYYY
jgi:hypothetical protein